MEGLAHLAEHVTLACRATSKVATLSLDEKQVFLGQFGRHGDEGGYLDDETVPAGSRCPTFASLVLQVSRTC